MATTAGSINTVTVSALTFITDALEDLRVVLDGASPTAGDVTKGMRKLNFALKKWAIKGWYLWVRDWIQVLMITNQYRYTIGPGGDVDTYRPLRVFPGSYVRQTCGTTSPNDVQLQILSRLEYDQMSQKGALGVPNSIYYDPQMAPSPLAAYDPANAQGVLYVWVAPDDMTRTIFLDVQRPIQDVTDTAQTFDLPLEWYEALTKNLASDMADAFEIPEQRITRIKQEARMALEEIADWGAMEQAPMQMTPDWRMTYGYNPKF
jgi:hypothetical protein